MRAPVFEIDAVQLAGLYKRLGCDGCGARLEPVTGRVWAKSGCGYFCPACAEARGLVPGRTAT